MTKGAHRRARLQIALWHFKIILLMASVFVPDKPVFCGTSVESLNHIQDVSKRSISILRGIIMTLWESRYNLQSGELNGQDVVEVRPACKTGCGYISRGNHLFKQECWMSWRVVAIKSIDTYYSNMCAWIPNWKTVQKCPQLKPTIQRIE